MSKEQTEKTYGDIKKLLQIRMDKEFIKKTAERELKTINKILERPNILPDEELDRLEMLYEAFLNIRDLY
jgi:hypothetical protein